MCFPGFLLGYTPRAHSPLDNVLCDVVSPLKMPACQSFPTKQSPFSPRSSKKGLNIFCSYRNTFPFLLFDLAKTFLDTVSETVGYDLGT